MSRSIEPGRPLRRWSPVTVWFMLSLFALVALANLVSLPIPAGEGDWAVVAIRVVFVSFFAAGIAACVTELRHRRNDQSRGQSEGKL